MIHARYVIDTAPGAAPRVAARMLGAANVEVDGGDGRSTIGCVVHGSSPIAVEAVVALLEREHGEIRGVRAGGD